MCKPKKTARQEAEAQLQAAQVTQELTEEIIRLNAQHLRHRYTCLMEAGFPEAKAYHIVQTRGLR